jgi:outer membrane protein OmpA-like peptidoglycan-associated protein
MKVRPTLIATLLLTVPLPVHADDWMVAEAPAAIAVSAAQEGVFRPGAMPAVGFYRDNGLVAFGLRMRAGVLRDGPAPENNMKDPGVGGLGSAGAAVRFGMRGFWVEAVGGVGITGHDTVPVLEAGVGWDMAVGPVDLGPSVRFLRVEKNDPTALLGSADLVLVGVDVQIGKARKKLAAPTIHYEAPVAVQADHDAVVDAEAGCVTDGTGCENELAAAVDAGLVEVTDDRIVLDERVLFDFDSARIRSAGRDVIAAIAQMWKSHPEWERITVEGHADVRGADDYNQALSQRRAERAREVLVHDGFATDRVAAVGFGRSRPRDAGTTEQAHRRNRRVEFVIVKREGVAR